MQINKTIRIKFFMLVFILMTMVSCQNNSTTDNTTAIAPAWDAWIKANHNTIRTLDTDDTDFSDLQFLKPLLEDRRLVQMGENGHGVREFSQAKVRLIKFLHEEMGYDVIAFESSIFECFYADLNAGTWTPEEMMGRSIFGVWYTEDVLELFKYIKESKKGAHPLILAGFDVQTSSSGRLKRPEVFKEAVARIDPAYAEEVFAMDTEILQKTSDYAWLGEHGDDTKKFYDKLKTWFDDHMEALVASYPQSPLLPRILRQTACSMTPFINELMKIESSYWEAFNFRDLGMADNVGVLAEQFYPDKKIMIWAHNGHVSYDYGKACGLPDMHVMGYWLSRRHRPILYTIGLFMYEGEAAWNDRSVFTIEPPDTDYLEAILVHADKPFAFVDMLHQTESPGNRWMFTSIKSIDWDNDEPCLNSIPRDQYDAALFVKTVHPPEFLVYYDLSGYHIDPDPHRN